MIKENLKILALLALIATSIKAEDVIINNHYFNASYDSAKNSILGGATTATAKGYSAMSSNPAGLSTNYNTTVYVRTIIGDTLDEEDIAVTSSEPADHLAIGALYNSFGLEYKTDDHIVAGGGYGYESKYGLFSAGISILIDLTNLAEKENSPVQRDEFATGDYLTYGLMWQKSFVGLDRYYALYFGLSHKNSGKYAGDTNTANVFPVSPSRTSYGFGFETNLDTSSILFTLDMSNEYWQSVSESLSGVGYGIKWLIDENLAVGIGVNEKVFSGSILKDIQTNALGVEYGINGVHLNIGYTNRIINDDTGVYLTDNAVHLDIAYTF